MTLNAADVSKSVKSALEAITSSKDLAELKVVKTEHLGGADCSGT